MDATPTPDAGDELARIDRALAWFEGQRGAIDDDLLDLALGPLRERRDAVGAGERPEQQLRQVTVLFCDVVGSTAMGQQLEPEDINVVMDAALARFTAIVERWRGRVLQYTGDGMLAAFGTEQAREDDAERAVMAGLGIVAEARVHGERVRHRHGRTGFDVRVGLHTGPVLLGGGVDGENTIRGSTVNLAARMEQNAQPGTLRVSADTWRLCAGAFVGVQQPPLLVKGRAEPMQTWLVERALPRRDRRTARGVAGRRAPLVGREAELVRLQAAWQRLQQRTGGAELIGLVGEAGLGKTRLQDSFDAWAREQAGADARPVLWLRAACLPQTASQPYGLLRTLLADALQLPDSEHPEAARERFVAALVPLFATGGTVEAGIAEAHVLGQLLGLDFAASPHVRGLLGLGTPLRTLAYHAAADVLARLSARRGRPLFLQLEDLHWADSGSLHFLRHLLALPHAAPLTLLAAARPTLDEVDPGWRGLEHERITLEPLPATTREALARALLEPLAHDAGGCEQVQSLLSARSAGNPYYMEELLQMLLDTGALAEATPAPRWQWDPSRLDTRRLPPTLTALLQARIDRLDPASRRALLQAAVLGPVFEPAALAALDAEAPAVLEQLVARGLIDPLVRSALEAGEAFAFAHQLLQQVAYGSLLRRERRVAHERAARWFAEAPSARAADRLVAAADHFEHAELADEAVAYSLRAAEELARHFAHDGVAAQAARGLRLAPADELDKRWTLLLLQQRALRHAGRHQDQEQALAAIETLARRSREPGHAATASLRRLVACQESGQTQRALELAPAAVAAAREARDEAVELAACNAWAGALRAGGQHDEADRIAAEALPRARAAGLHALESELLLGRAAVATERGDVAAAERHARQALVIDRELGNRVGECVGLVNLGANALQRGDFAQARNDLDAAMALCRAIGRRQFEVSVRLNLSALELALGDAQAAAAAAAQARELATAIAQREFAAFAALSHGAACLAQGDAVQAGASYRDGRDELLALGLPHLAIEAVAGLARAAHARGDTAEACRQAELVHAHWLRHGHFDGTERPVEIALACFDAWGGEADPRGLSLLRQAWDSLQARAAQLPEGPERERWLHTHEAHRRLLDVAARQGWTGGDVAVAAAATGPAVGASAGPFGGG